MPKDLNVLLIEDDPFARDLMGMLMARDWRTRVIDEAGSEEDVRRVLGNAVQKYDAVILDTEVPGDPEWPFRIAAAAREAESPPEVVFTGTRPNEKILKRIIARDHGGYLMKPEIRYSLVTAVAMASKRDRFVITPSVYRAALQARTPLPNPTFVVDGRVSTHNLTPREEEIARLAILFNHPHRELSDELLIRADQVAKHVSNVYTKLGLNQVLSGDIAPEAFFEDALILKRFREILDRVTASGSRRKTADMATLAFHLLTVPDVEEVI